MPTNLKSLLSRSRSRNELKLREKSDEGVVVCGGDVSPEAREHGGNGGSPGAGPGRVTIGTAAVAVGTLVPTPSAPATGRNCSPPDFLPTTSPALRKDPPARSFFSCGALHGVGLVSNKSNSSSSRSVCHGEARACLCCCGGQAAAAGATTTTTTVSSRSGSSMSSYKASTGAPSSSSGSSSSGSSSSSSTSCCACCLPPPPLPHEIVRESGQSLRKCETVLALSSFTGNPTGGTIASSSLSSTISSSTFDMRTGKGCSGGRTDTHPNSSCYSTTTTTTPTSGTSSPSASSPSSSSSSSSSSTGRVKGMKDKILSTSSSTLNSLIHSSTSRSRLFPGWKLPGGGGGGSSSSAAATAGGVVAGAGAVAGGSGCGMASPNGNPSGPYTLSPQNPSCPVAVGHAGGLLLSSGESESGGSVTSGSPTSHLCHHGMLMMSGGNSRSQLSIAETPVTPVNRLRRNASNSNNSCFTRSPSSSTEPQPPYSRSSSLASFNHWKEDPSGTPDSPPDIFCRLCLSSYALEETCEVEACSCRYCKDCLVAYMSFEIQEGAYDIACPDASCDKEGVLTLAEIEKLVPAPLMDKHRKFRLFREVEKDGQVMWCPSPGCETICCLQFIGDGSDKARPGFSRTSITCTTCEKMFCAECKLSWHPDSTCESFRRKLVKQGKLSVDDEEIYAIESIKKCPFCFVPIEKDSGCAQMMCKRCKHVFCWYCLASLDDDFLLRHYDKGPCKNKLGHTRASVVWHRAQVIGIFAGFGVLVLLASPLLILAAPCLLCCRCRYCANKLDPEDPVSL